MSTIQTGIAGLDEILCGGIPRENSVLIKGPPGSGKTILAMQVIYNGIVESNEPGLIISFEEFPQMIYRDAKSMGWDFRELERQKKLRVMSTSPQVILEQLGAGQGVLVDMIKEIGARRVAVDNITHLQRLEQDPVKLRELLNRLINGLKRQGLTPLLIAETAAEQGRVAFEEYVVDSAIILSEELKGRISTRYLRVVKSRGRNVVPGLHTFKITTHGLEVFPRVTAPVTIPDHQPVSETRNSFGITELDNILGGGLLKGDSLLLAGDSGSGKSLLGLQFLMQGAQQGESGLLVALEEHPRQIVKNAATLGFDLAELIREGKVTILCTSPGELDLNEHLHALKQMVQTNGIKRIVIDTISNYESSVDDPIMYKEYIHAIVNWFKNCEVTSILITEVDELLGLNTITFHKVPFLVDTIILLRYVQLGTELRKALLVVKMRGGAHARDIREYVIEEQGIKVRKINPKEVRERLSFQHCTGLLSQSPRQRSDRG
ncbi:MAG: AAA family ATPase [Firmicutes bacterium]|nr:AAA family ATPase [Bacillota bacterium]